jgi:hypothetical protein
MNRKRKLLAWICAGLILIAIIVVLKLLGGSSVQLSPGGTVSEQVKCIFSNSKAVQKCYSSDGSFGCSGTTACLAKASGEKGAKITWNSSCGDSATTTIDGRTKTVRFYCGPRWKVTGSYNAELSGCVNCYYCSGGNIRSFCKACPSSSVSPYDSLGLCEMSLNGNVFEGAACSVPSLGKKYFKGSRLKCTMHCYPFGAELTCRY